MTVRQSSLVSLSALQSTVGLKLGDRVGFRVGGVVGWGVGLSVQPEQVKSHPAKPPQVPNSKCKAQ